ncbi:MAG: 1-acyl-sn-glycerol-3-phosphate acyltransferase, partial [Gemmatimonadetes bacterium]|nr:1-acyl-sn-glycerol-3-phosphate acyltransferase [Gemmatimonadota bacterium]
FVSKAEVRRWPFWGAMAAMAGTIFIDRGRKRDTVRVLREMDRAFERGDSVVVFPEATSTDGSTIWPFKSSLLAAAAAAGNPVEWMTVRYHTPDPETSARLQVCWWGDMGFFRHFLGLCALRRIEARVAFGDQPQSQGDRKALARTLRTLMLNRHQPVR